MSKPRWFSNTFLDVVGADNMVGPEAHQVAGGCVVFVAVHVSITIEPFPRPTVTSFELPLSSMSQYVYNES